MIAVKSYALMAQVRHIKLAQGVSLVPLLFVTYINDIVKIPESPEIIMYADDTNILTR